MDTRRIEAEHVRFTIPRVLLRTANICCSLGRFHFIVDEARAEISCAVSSVPFLRHFDMDDLATVTWQATRERNTHLPLHMYVPLEWSYRRKLKAFLLQGNLYFLSSFSDEGIS